MRHFAALRATCVEAWQDALDDVALPAWFVRLDAAARDLLIEACWRRERGERPLPAEALEEVVLGLEEGVLSAQTASPEGAAFVRTGFRAPNDSAIARENDRQVDGGPEALAVLLESRRVFEDLCLAQECAYEPSLVVRPWIEVAPSSELRAFVRERRLVGLSQRLTETPLPALGERAEDLEARVQRRCEELRQRWPLPDLVVDFVVRDDEGALVLDLHPWLDWCDPALFSWQEDTFERYAFRTLS
ncbi:MAG: hypothetical protein D6731_06385 [Planctomycetota bacterium]|nr:MAG: hypothetical protein D6731_06385 [Planctomycetota bacterium]